MGAGESGRRTVKVRNLELGSGLAEVCVPIVAEHAEELELCLRKIRRTSCDLVEFRADHYRADDVTALQEIRRAVGERPILYTLRTAEEGGTVDPTPEAYAARNLQAAPYCDLVDVQLGRLGDGSLLDALHREGVQVVGSFHDFSGTPDADALVQTLLEMQEAGFDITKLAVMPHSRADVLQVLQASARMAEGLADRPYITLSMGALGVVTRAATAFTGSCLTFGTAGAASAPGQPEAGELLRALELFGEI